MDRRKAWSTESCLRRSLEALFDLGQRLLERAIGIGVSEYKEVASALAQQGVLSAEEAEVLRRLAGYRNRLVHFYHEVSVEELHEVCATHLGDVEQIQRALSRWLASHPERLDQAL